jgi:predicted Zn-dependent peptidase
MDSLDKAGLASLFGKKTTKKRKQEREHDTPAAREARILAYMFRVQGEDGKRKLGANGNPINLFTGEEYTNEELKVEGDINDDNE